ncbi:MAG: hypothetical protein BMS9Abin26_2103 [Gammaproteobacteria bacterium]|nr:MAG: hypothetical protein BMS9Abin26_2103 [Gammaproteobacteria bacterium]
MMSNTKQKIIGNFEKLVIASNKIQLPMLRHTASALKELEIDENTSYNRISDIAAKDPGLTIALFKMVHGKDPKRSAEIESVREAIMMLGLNSAEQIIEKMAIFEDYTPEAVQSELMAVFSRSFFAARQAYEWTRARHDILVDEVYTATLLYELGEMILWYLVPNALRRIAQLHDRQNIPQDEAEYVTLGFSIQEYTMALAEQWGLPTILVHSLNPENANEQRAYGVMLANKFAQISAQDWNSEESQELTEAVAAYLQLPFESAHRWIMNSANDSVTDELYADSNYSQSLRTTLEAEEEKEAAAAAALMEDALLGTGTEESETDSEPERSADDRESTSICLMPRNEIYLDTIARLTEVRDVPPTPPEIINDVMHGLHEGVGLNRVVFALLHKDGKSINAKFLRGTENDPLFNRFEITLDPDNLFTHLMTKSQSLWINDSNRERYWSMLPNEFIEMINVECFFCISIVAKGKPVGLIYADRHGSKCLLDAKSYSEFKKVCLLAAKRLEIARMEK